MIPLIDCFKKADWEENEIIHYMKNQDSEHLSDFYNNCHENPECASDVFLE
ncbi:MAG: hypothetical protein ACON5A_03730 [Candidatus Comchoanobacterales bacterium]